LIRKTAPKEWVDYLNGKGQEPEPSEVYIYCTKGIRQKLFKDVYAEKSGNGPLFYCDAKDHDGWSEPLNGKVVAKFTLREVEKFDFISDREYLNDIEKYNAEIRKHNAICKKSCMSTVEMVCYLDTKCLGTSNPNGMIGYAWHISDLVIFDKPMELSNFIPREWDKCMRKDRNGLYQCHKCPYGDKVLGICKWKPLTKAPRGWQYVEAPRC